MRTSTNFPKQVVYKRFSHGKCGGWLYSQGQTLNSMPNKYAITLILAGCALAIRVDWAVTG